MARRRVAVTQRAEYVSAYGETRDALDQEWAVWIQSLGFTPIPIPNQIDDVGRFINDLDVCAVFLSGGNDVGADVGRRHHGQESLYPSAVSPRSVSTARDQTEQALIEHTATSGVPLIAWCRGLQLLQAHFGGKLISTAGRAVQHVAASHSASIVEVTSLTEASDITVNSFHDFGIESDALAAPLRPLAVSEDGLIEAAYHPDLPIIACQWHPERPGGDDTFNRGLVASLIDRLAATEVSADSEAKGTAIQ